jgi:hypothetical protein
MQINGNILDFDTNCFVIHQCNCICSKPKGLALSIAVKYPYADPYSWRKQEGSRNVAIEVDHDIPGTYKLFKNESKPTDPIYVAIFGQYGMGKVNRYYGDRPQKYDDSTINRLKWFRNALFDFGQYIKDNYKEKQSVYIPFKIGCGLAGGRWSFYLPIIKEFQKTYNDNLICYIVKYDEL